MKPTAYLFQAALICLWWIGLASNPKFFAAFQFTGIPPVAFWCFLVPDLLAIAGLSIARAYRQPKALEYVILGAFSYATLYCCSATVLTRSGYLPTGLMLLGLGYNLFICFNPSLFRVSASSLFANVLKTFLQIVCIWTLTLVVIPYVILEAFHEDMQIVSGPWLWMAIVCLIGFSSLGLSSAYCLVRDGSGTPIPLDQTNHLVVSGPYRYVRNPMAIAGIGQGIAVAMLFQSLPLLVYALLGAVVWQLVVRPIEERDMVRRFGEPYEIYRKRVRCWIPTLFQPVA